MAVKPILQLGNPILWQRSALVSDVVSPMGQALATDLKDTLEEFRRTQGKGRGIAAPQMGVLQRVIYVSTSQVSGALFNPRIDWTSLERMELWDDCFSFPNLMVRVHRFEQVRVSYVDLAGSEQTLHAQGGLSELLQHQTS